MAHAAAPREDMSDASSDGSWSDLAAGLTAPPSPAPAAGGEDPGSAGGRWFRRE